ncbi:MAG TPA: hypothetical protein VIZ30_07875, partial [Pseudomonadales bacterium]
FIALDGADPDASLSEAYPELVLFSTSTETLREGVYIADPLGNVVLRYEFRDAGKPVLDDLKKLLKVSHIG